VYEIRLHDDAEADLAHIRKANEDAAARILTFLDEYLTDSTLQYSLAVEEFENEVFGVDRITAFQQIGYDAWRIKLAGLDITLGPLTGQRAGAYLNHRIVYAFDDQNGVIWILGIFKRKDYDYDPNDAIGKRIRDAYDYLGLPRRSYIH